MTKSNKVDIFNSTPLLLIGESDREFDRLRIQLEQEFKPQGIIVAKYVDDVLVLMWEMRRLRRIKMNIIRIARLNALELLLLRIDAALMRGCDNSLKNEAKRLALGWLEKNGDEEIVRAILNQAGLDESAIDAEAFKRALPNIQEVDDMLKSSEERFDKALRRISKYEQSRGLNIRSSARQILLTQATPEPANDSSAA